MDCSRIVCFSFLPLWFRAASIVAVLVVQCWSINFCRADEGSDAPVVWYFPTAKGLVDYFANLALLVDRGVVRSPFEPSADEILIQQLKDSEELRKMFQLTAGQNAILSTKRIAKASLDSQNEEAKTGFPSDDVPASVALDLLNKSTIKNTQKETLLGAYLRIEGLAALRRKEFQAIDGISDKQQEEVDRLFIGYSDQASDYHKAIFTLSNDEFAKLPKIYSKLRVLSAELDCKIAALLTENQYKQLEKPIAQAIEIAHLIPSEGGGLPKRVGVKR